ncbi:MAG TPA: hypothetical protein VHM90_06295 [Phycisphaerae bacterium]|nr:hypothetical protein [Phycisphaerae bacterium]
MTSRLHLGIASRRKTKLNDGEGVANFADWDAELVARADATNARFHDRWKL